MSTPSTRRGRKALVAVAAAGIAAMVLAWWCPAAGDPFAHGGDDPVPFALALLRATVALTGAYLLSTAVLAAAACVTTGPGLGRLVTHWTVPGLRPLIRTAVGAGAIGVLAGGVPAGALSTPAAVVATAAAPLQPPTMTVEVAVAPADPPVVMSAAPEPASPAPAPPPVVPRPGDAAPAAPGTAAPGTGRWRIQPGDHLWRVAEQTLATSWGRMPTPTEVAPYWRAVVELNRPNLLIRDEPDLVFPGQEFDLPPVPER